MTAARLVAGVIALPQVRIGRELAARRRPHFVNPATHFLAYGAAQGDATGRLAVGTAHAGHDIVDFFERQEKKEVRFRWVFGRLRLLCIGYGKIVKGK